MNPVVKQTRWTRPWPAVAAAVVGVAVTVAGCSSDPGRPVPDERAVTCARAIGAAEAFVATHPGGPGSLDAGERAEFDEVVAVVEGACDGDRLARFGPEVLEPWTLPGGPGAGPPTTGAPTTG